jgi:hypothetical protein
MSQFGEMMRRARRAAQSGDWAPKPGPHKAVVVDTDVRSTRAGDTVVGLELELRDDGPDRGRRWEHPVFFTSEKAQEMAAQTLAVYGIPAEVWDACEDEDELARALDEHVHGREVDVTVKPRDNGDAAAGVWTNVVMSRGPGSDVPADQTELAVGEPRARSAVTHDGDLDDPPF